MKVIITEKPSVAKELAKVFGVTNRKDGYIDGGDYTFTWAFGHLLQLASPEAYGFIGWKKENLPMLPERFKLAVRQIKEKDGKFKNDPGVIKQLQVIKSLFEQATEIIVATDAGREGELIFRYIYYHLKIIKPFKRLWISSQTDEAIKEGFRNLKPGSDYDSLFFSAQCRSESDWIVGLNATQALSIAAGNRSVLSLGRVQTPTLAMISARYKEHKEFKPQTYYQVAIHLSKNGDFFRALSMDNFNTKEEAQQILDRVRDIKSGYPQGGNIQEVEIKLKKEPPPLLHDLTSLQQEGNKKKGFTAEETLAIAQKLYETKLITYPRTGSRYIGDDVFAEIPALIQKANVHSLFGKYAHKLFNQPLNKRSVNAAKVSDHHALLPTNQYPTNLSADQQTIYDMIVSRMLEAFSPQCLKELTKITVESGSLFTATGTVIQSPGWRSVLNEPEENEEENISLLPKVDKGDQLPIYEKAILEKQTKPKPLYNEATLLKAMETAGKEIEDEELRQAMKETGLGTPATRANIIETLIKRQYIVREKKNLIPSATGLAVYELVKEKSIAQSALTGLWEKKLEEIRRGGSVSAFKKEIREYAKNITNELLQTGNNISNILQHTERPDKISCPICKTGAIRFNEKAAGCSEYKSGCKFVVWRNIAEKKLTDNQLKVLITKGKTGVIKGFKSKTGKTFDAVLRWADSRVEFEKSSIISRL